MVVRQKRITWLLGILLMAALGNSFPGLWDCLRGRTPF